ncbi:ABC-type multidrug transport system, ATPase and permease component [Proteiniborus ethanoligenes]|uniref:ABC-type multidrug transport system, ATPase and permease component n=1 Tax=Proteiniborus ethanoligenes TaxID=415015 RepID=A0A1H3R5Y3_9FIRM|nr:ABC transporter ATP-binding protein [Proteiniborus ethanoligenes]TAH61347.1 MAG: ABC transporter ATP-binding protein [Gottschalkiaceae bacterium]SDZ21087.1 ABC-type multidrug transport system, ATPase and permease component [Proteiniborus ethanoligenes]
MKKSIYKALPYLLLVLVIASAGAVLEGYLSITMMDTIDMAVSGNRDMFNKEAIKLLLLALSLLPVNVLLAVGKGLYKRKAIVSAKVNYVSRIFKKNINEFQRDNNAKYVSTLTNDVNTIETNYIDGIYEIILGVVYFIVGIIVIAYVSPLSLALGLGIGFVSTLVSILLNKPIQKHQAQRSELYEGYTSYIKEVLSAFHIIKANNLNEKVKNDFFNKSNAIQQKGYIIDQISTFIFSLQNLNMMISLFALLGITSYMAIKGSLTLGGVILIVNNMEKIIVPIMRFGEWLPKILSTKKLFEKIENTMENQDNYEETIVLEKFNHTIEFNNVSFGYENGDVLNNINLSLKKGEKYLVIGPSGGGKSTLLKLLRKYFSPKDGEILIDKANLKDVTKGSYFKHISNIEQQVFLFEDTLRNNITLYKDFSEEDINIAIERAGLKSFVQSLPQGLDTMIYDNGKNISGGEKSRVAIARGLLQKTDIIFLDEAFSSLDSKIAKEIENTILSLEGITVVNVSHVVFEDTKTKYDNVYVVKNKGVYSV